MFRPESKLWHLQAKKFDFRREGGGVVPDDDAVEARLVVDVDGPLVVDQHQIRGRFGLVSGELEDAGVYRLGRRGGAGRLRAGRGRAGFPARGRRGSPGASARLFGVLWTNTVMCGRRKPRRGGRRGTLRRRGSVAVENRGAESALWTPRGTAGSERSLLADVEIHSLPVHGVGGEAWDAAVGTAEVCHAGEVEVPHAAVRRVAAARRLDARSSSAREAASASARNACA